MSTHSTKSTVIHTNKDSLGEGARSHFLFSFETFSEIESALEEIFSPSAASVVLHSVAIKAGANSCKRIMRKAKTREAALNHLSELKGKENWGKLSFENVDITNGSGKVIIIDSFETVARKTNQPGCHLFRGFLEGFLSELFGKKIEITEEKCAGKGDRHCELLFE